MSGVIRPDTPPPAGKKNVNDANTRSVDKPAVLIGAKRARYDPRKYSHLPSEGEGEQVKFNISVTRDDRMSVGEARERLDQIHARLVGGGKSTRELKILDAFDAALWFCHTVNSASTLVPGRSTFSVPGSTIDFSYAEVLNILGVDARRFFRTYADDIAEANKRVLASYDPSDPVSVENWSWLMDVATSRGLARFPHLAHDSADACLNLNMSERVALAESKALVIGSTANTADTAHANDRVPSAPMPRETRPK